MPISALAATGRKPEWKPVTLVLVTPMGVQGAPKVDCVTVWLPAWNWNCTNSPGWGASLSGE
jgi:hypothetical protein